MASLLTDRAFLWIGALLYLGGFVTGLIGLTGRREGHAGHRTLLNIFLVGGWILQWLGLYQRGMASGGCPLGNTFEIVQFVAWSAMLVYFFVGTAFRLSLLGLFTAGYAATLALVSLLITHWDMGHAKRMFGDNPWIEAHAALAVFSYGIFGLLALTCLMQLLQNWSLKNKRLNGLFWFLPSVVQLEQINYRLVLLGVTLLTFSLGVGASWWVRNTDSVHLPKLMVALGVWFAYLVILFLRWRGRIVSVRFAWVGLIMFCLALLSLGVINANWDHNRPVTLTPR